MERLSILPFLKFPISHQTGLNTLIIKYIFRIVGCLLIFSSDVCISQSEDSSTSPLEIGTVWLMETVNLTVLPTTVLATYLLEDDAASTLLVTRVREQCCPLNYIEIENGCFQFVGDPLTFEEATNDCVNKNGGSLAKLDPIEAITTYIIDSVENYSDAEYVWIGLEEDQISENSSFRWTFDETLLNISNWANREPMSFRRNQCVVLSINGSWLLQPCNETTIPYICQSTMVYCGELTTAPEITTDEYTTNEITERSTTTPTLQRTSSTATATTNTMKISPTHNLTTSILTTTQNTQRKTNSTTISDEPITADDVVEATTEMITYDEETVTMTTKKLTYASTVAVSYISTVGALSTNVPPVIPTTTITANTTNHQPSSDNSMSATRSQPITSPGSTRLPVSVSTTSAPGLSRITKVLISLIVIFLVLIFLVLCVIFYLLYKRQQSKQKTYNVEQCMELDDIQSIEDITAAGPSTSTVDEVPNTSVNTDDVPEFSGSMFSGLRGKRYSYDIT